jgi:hypothetical protein
MANIGSKILLMAMTFVLSHWSVQLDAKGKKQPPSLIQSVPMEMPVPMMAPAPPNYPKVRAVKIEGSISMEDYPVELLDNHEEGKARANFTVKANGEVGNCNAYGASPRLNQYSCSLVKQRFRYKAAEGYDGKPMDSQQTQYIDWRLTLDPGDDYVRTAKKFAIAYNRTITLDIDPKGVVSGCVVSGGDPNTSRDGFVCSLAKEQWTFAIERDEDDKPVASTRIFAPDLPLPDAPRQEKVAPTDL